MAGQGNAVVLRRRRIPSDQTFTHTCQINFKTEGAQCVSSEPSLLDSALEEEGFEPSVPRVMDGDSGRQVPTLIAVFKLAGTAVALQRGTKVVRPDRHPEFR